MDALSLAAILDIMSKIGVVGVSGLFLWLMFTDRLQTRGHVDELKKAADDALADRDKEIAQKDKLIARLDERLKAIENALARMHTPRAE